MTKNNSTSDLNHSFNANNLPAGNEAVLDSLTEHIVYQNTQLEILWANKAAGESVGLKKEELIGRHCYEVWHHRTEPCQGCPVVKAAETGEPHQAEMMSPDGRVWFIRGYPVRDGNEKVIGVVELTLDITERKKAEMALRESEENYRSLYETALVGWWRTRIEDGMFLKVNPALVRALGFNEESELVGKHSAAEFYSSQTRKELLRQLKECGEVSQFDARFTLKDGTVKDTLLSAKIHPEKGCIDGTIIDITERKQAEEALRDSEEKYRLLFASESDAIIIVDAETRQVVDANETACRLYDYTRTEMLKLKATELSAEPEKSEASIVRTIANKVDHVIYRNHRKKDGTVFPVEISASLFPWKGRHMICGICRDITERRRAEQLIQRSEKKYRHLVETIAEGMAIVDFQENLLFCNTAASEILGYSREELIGMNLKQLFVENDMPKIYEGTQKRKKGISSKYEATIRRKDGELRQLYVSATPYLDSIGGVEGSIGIFSDITDIRRAEEEKKKLQEQLAKAQRMESLGVLAGGVAHDLNNILGPLVAYPEMILMKLPADSPARKQIEMLGKSARDAADVIQDLLTLARRGRYEMSPISLNEVLEAYMASPNLIELMEKNPNVKIEKTLDPAIQKIHGSAPHLMKAIMNLVVNAFDAMPNGGRLTIEVTQSHIDSLPGGYTNVVKGDYVVFKIRDTGVGINEKYLKRIFEPYYSKKEMGSSGSGLGLSVVYGIVKDHKGYYDVGSRVGEGTEFTLYFPVSRDEVLESSDRENDYSGTETVLIVDDIAEQRQIAAELLSSLGYKVESVSSGRQAVKYLTENTVDIIVLDMIMEKDFDGLDTYREIVKLHPHQKAVIVSGFSATDRVNETIELGAGRYIKKPYTRVQIGKAIREELDRKEIIAVR